MSTRSAAISARQKGAEAIWRRSSAPWSPEYLENSRTCAAGRVGHPRGATKGNRVRCLYCGARHCCHRRPALPSAAQRCPALLPQLGASDSSGGGTAGGRRAQEQRQLNAAGVSVADDACRGAPESRRPGANSRRLARRRGTLDSHHRGLPVNDRNGRACAVRGGGVP